MLGHGWRSGERVAAVRAAGRWIKAPSRDGSSALPRCASLFRARLSTRTRCSECVDVVVCSNAVEVTARVACCWCLKGGDERGPRGGGGGVNSPDDAHNESLLLNEHRGGDQSINQGSSTSGASCAQPLSRRRRRRGALLALLLLLQLRADRLAARQLPPRRVRPAVVLQVVVKVVALRGGGWVFVEEARGGCRR